MFPLSFSREIGEDPCVKTAAKLFRTYCYDYRDSLSAGIVCAGWDKYDGGQVKIPTEYIILCTLTSFLARPRLISLRWCRLLHKTVIRPREIKNQNYMY